MANTKYSQLETKFNDQEDFGYLPEVRRRRSSNLFTSLWFTAVVAFCVGILATFGAIRLCESIGKRDTDWLSKSVQCNTNLLGYETHRKMIGPPGIVKVQFQYNDTYPGPPTMESEYAWLDLLPGKMTLTLTEEETLTDPDGLGAVQHDDLSDAIVTLSVFHQLHCLVRFAIMKGRVCLSFADGPTTRGLR